MAAKMSTAMGNHSEGLPGGAPSNPPTGLKARTIRLPIPPSVNEAYGNNSSGKGRGRYKTKKYKAWERSADNEALIAGLFHHGKRPLVTGRANIVLRLPHYMRGDVDNRIKPTLDYLVDRGFTQDDSTHQSVTAVRDPTLGRVAFCEVDVSEASG